MALAWRWHGAARRSAACAPSPLDLVDGGMAVGRIAGIWPAASDPLSDGGVGSGGGGGSVGLSETEAASAIDFFAAPAAARAPIRSTTQVRLSGWRELSLED
eukprot:6829487-Prymnesium_polylepis.1